MGKYDKEVKKKLRDNQWQLIMDSVDRDVINAQHMVDIAQQMGPKVSGNHGKRVREGVTSDRYEMRQIFSDWWEEGMSEMHNRDVIEKLVTILSSDSVGLRALADQMCRNRRAYEKERRHKKSELKHRECEAFSRMAITPQVN